MNNYFDNEYPTIYGEGKVSLCHRKGHGLIEISSIEDDNIVGNILYRIGAEALEKVKIHENAIQSVDNILNHFSNPMYIDLLSIHRKHQGRGFAKDALLLLDQLAKAENVDFIFAWPYPLGCADSKKLENYKSLLKLLSSCGYTLYDSFECLEDMIPIGTIYGKLINENN